MAATSALRSRLGTPMRAAWRGHRDLLTNALSLLGTTGVTSGLGFAYWAVAAHLFRQQTVGYGSAAVSAMMLLATIGMFGLGTMLIGELPRQETQVHLISAALLAAGAGALVLGLGFVIVSPYVSPHLGHIVGPLGHAAVFSAGVAVIAVSLVFDNVTIGLLRGGLQLLRNIAFAVSKLLLLPLAAIVLRSALGLTLPWVAGAALSLVLVATRVRLSGVAVLPRPDWGHLRRLGRITFTHNWLNLAIVAPAYLMPVLVTVIVSPSANAAFYAAWMIAGFLWIFPQHLSMTLYAVVSADPDVIARKLRFTLRLSFLVGLPGMLLLGLGAHTLLSLFGPGYARLGTFPLWIFVCAYVAVVPKVHYIDVCRATGKIARAAILLTAAATAEVTAAAVGGALGGLRGLSLALLGVLVVEGLITAPAVLRAAFCTPREGGNDAHSLDPSR